MRDIYAVSCSCLTLTCLSSVKLCHWLDQPLTHGAQPHDHRHHTHTRTHAPNKYMHSYIGGMDGQRIFITCLHAHLLQHQPDAPMQACHTHVGSVSLGRWAMCRSGTAIVYATNGNSDGFGAAGVCCAARLDGLAVDDRMSKVSCRCQSGNNVWSDHVRHGGVVGWLHMVLVQACDIPHHQRTDPVWFLFLLLGGGC